MSSQILLLCALVVISKAYRRVESQMSRDNGETECVNARSHLATITSDDQLSNAKFVCQESDLDGTSAPGCWIGLYYDGSNWKWKGGFATSGTPVKYGFNAVGIPTNIAGKPWKTLPPATTSEEEICVMLDKTDTDFRWITQDCATSTLYPFCDLTRHRFRADCSNESVGSCTVYSNTWEPKTPAFQFKEPVYWSNGVVVALTGELQWTGSGPMGASDNVIFNINNQNDRPYFPLEFSVTNNNGINCVIRVNSESPGDVRIISWSVPIVYVNTADYLDNSWYVWDVKQIADPTGDGEIFINIEQEPPCQSQIGESECQTLAAYSWVEFDGIVWVSQGSGLNKIATESSIVNNIVIPPIKPDLPETNVKMNVPIEHDAKFVKPYVYNVKDNSFYVIVIVIMIGCAVFGLFVGIGLKWIELKTRNQYYTKLVNETEESSYS